MRFISFILLFCLTTNVFAATGTIQELERQFDEYNYALTVEWDQKDQAVYDQHTQAFMKKLDVLYKEKGLAFEDVMLMLEKRTQNIKLLEALKLKASLLGKNATPAEIFKALAQENIYVQGASWNGNVQMFVIGGVLLGILAIVVAYDSWWDKNHTCTKFDQAEQCVDEYDCRGENCYYDGSYCSMITRCTKYERNE